MTSRQGAGKPLTFFYSVASLSHIHSNTFTQASLHLKPHTHTVQNIDIDNLGIFLEEKEIEKTVRYSLFQFVIYTAIGIAQSASGAIAD